MAVIDTYKCILIVLLLKDFLRETITTIAAISTLGSYRYMPAIYICENLRYKKQLYQVYKHMWSKFAVPSYMGAMPKTQGQPHRSRQDFNNRIYSVNLWRIPITQ